MSDALADLVRECMRAAIRAADPRRLTADALHDWSDGAARGSVDVIAIGKAAPGMLRGAMDALGDAVRGGILIAPEAPAALPAGVAAFVGGHPMPNRESLLGAEAITRAATAAGHASRVLVLVSGGASSLMTMPAAGVSLDDLTEVSRALMSAGADIRELNCVRKHLDQLKGGRMAGLFAHAHVRALVLSDVIGDPLDVIASGPLVADPTTFDDAIAVLRARRAWEAAPASVREYLVAGSRGEHPETPKAGDQCFANTEIRIIGNNALAVGGAVAEAQRRGCDVELVEAPIAGEARAAGAAFARLVIESRERSTLHRPLAIVGGGETTVTVTGHGAGGRNLEFVASAAILLENVLGVVIGSIGTDGSDGNSGAAGAVANGDTARLARTRGAELSEALATNNTLPALDLAGAVERTGLTGTNVMDVQVGIVSVT